MAILGRCQCCYILGTRHDCGHNTRCHTDANIHVLGSRIGRNQDASNCTTLSKIPSNPCCMRPAHGSVGSFCSRTFFNCMTVLVFKVMLHTPTASLRLSSSCSFLHWCSVFKECCLTLSLSHSIRQPIGNASRNRKLAFVSSNNYAPSNQNTNTPNRVTTRPCSPRLDL